MPPPTPTNAPNIWAQMGYTPPRGGCNFKPSVVSIKCPCLRFMVHPLKVSTSFECDGCCHHASFHNMGNALDDSVVAGWAEQQRRQDREREREREARQQEIEEQQLELSAPRKKRPRRAIAAPPPMDIAGEEVLTMADGDGFVPVEKPAKRWRMGG